MDKKNKKQEEKIELKPLKIGRLRVVIGGDSLLMNNLGSVAKKVLESYQKSEVKDTKKSVKKIDPEKDFNEKIHKTFNGKVGFPVCGVKKGMQTVVCRLGLPQSVISGQMIKDTLFVFGSGKDIDITPIKFDKMIKNSQWGRIMGRPVLITRPEFIKWSCEVVIEYNIEVLSAEKILNILNWAGFHKGLGDYRPENGGSYGKYKVIKVIK